MSTTLSGGLGLKTNSVNDTLGQLVSDLEHNFSVLDGIYPVGSIYMSTASTNPATFIGGTWSRLENRFLVGAGATFPAGTTGGSSGMGVKPCGGESSGYGLVSKSDAEPAWPLGFTDRVIVNDQGYSGEVLPPYRAVYMWERTA